MAAVHTPPIGIIGVGQLAAFLVEGWHRQMPPGRFLLSPRNRARAVMLAERFGATVAGDNQQVVDAADPVIVATRPRDLLDCVSGLRWRPGQVLVSVAIDVGRAAIEAAAPGTTVVRAMPVSAVTVGAGSTPIYPPHPGIEALFARLGPVHALGDEAAYDAASALAGFYGWILGLVDAVAERAAFGGMPRAVAHAHARDLVAGAMALATARPEKRMRAFLDETVSPGSMTGEGLALLEAERAIEPWLRAYDGALRRLRGR